MENAPITADDDSETSTKSNKKDTKKLGFMAVERPGTQKDKREKSFFSKLTEKADEQKQLKKESVLKPILAESEPVPETQAPLEKPSKSETVDVIQPQLIKVIEELEADKQPDPITDPPVNKFRELVKSGAELEVALNEVLSDLGVEEETNAVDVIEETVETNELEHEPDINVGLEAEPDMPLQTEIREFDQDEVMVNLNDEADPDISTPSPVTTGGSANPPTPPPPFGPPFGGPPNPFNPANHPANSPPVNPNLSPPEQNHEPEYSQASPAAMALFGGIIGYLIGRRRGRIKTEKKLLPVQKKLEKEVTNLQFQIQEKEKKIRRVAAEKVKQEGPAIIEVFNKPVPIEHAEERQKAPEAQQLHGPKHAHEHIGKVIVTAESKFTNRGNTGNRYESKPEAKKVEQVEVPNLTERRVETLNRAELLDISEKIVVGESNLRKIFETHLVSEKGLRRLVNVHLKGGDIKKALQMEIVEHEIDFERDPAMRDIAPVSAPGQASSQTTLDQMLKQATEKVGGHDPEQAYYKNPKSAHGAQSDDSPTANQQVLDIVFVAIIVILLTMVIYLAFFR